MHTIFPRNVPLLKRMYSYWSDGHIDPISIVAGLVQTALYVDFFHVYFTKCVDSALAANDDVLTSV